MQGLLNFSGRRFLPVIRQTEAAECGLACLAMIASYHGHRTDMNSLRRRHPVSLKGVTLRDLYPSPEWNYVFGEASIKDRVGIYSFARYDPHFFGEDSPDRVRLIRICLPSSRLRCNQIDGDWLR